MIATFWSEPVTSLQAGDRWISSDCEVHVTDVNVVAGPTEYYPDGFVVVSGRIIRGYGKAKKIRRWTFHTIQTLDFERA